MKANGVNTPFFYCMIIQRPDFCDPSRRIMLSSCILLRCLDIALLLIFNLLAISREVILAFSDISCRMASRVSGPPFWSTFLLSLFFFECEVIIHRFLVLREARQYKRCEGISLPVKPFLMHF